jgi:exopolyphosphatase/guanosine-5'-triphosphate,3'-diphosphate pyrophosphatase
MGLAVSYGHHHRHAAYLATHSDLPGFSRDDQQTLAALLATQRRKIAPTIFGSLPRRWRDRTLKLAVLLRLAIILNRPRSDDLPLPRTCTIGGELHLIFPGGYLDDRPLTRLDLEAESRALRPTGYRIVIEEDRAE